MCWVIKSISEFNRKGTASDGLDPHCRGCNSARHAERMATDSAYREMMRTSTRESKRRVYPIRREEIRQQVKERRRRYVVKNANRVKDPSVLRKCAGACGRVLPETEFRLDRGVNDGLRARCCYCSDAWKRSRAACLKSYGDPVGLICYLCGLQIYEASVAWVDHVVPQSKGGPDTAENLRWTHDICNLRRRDYPLTPEQAERFKATAPAPFGESK